MAFDIAMLSRSGTQLTQEQGWNTCPKCTVSFESRMIVKGACSGLLHTIPVSPFSINTV